MAETVFDRIDMMESYATKQEKVIIEYIRSNPIRDMILLSITEFSEKVGVGDATMLRFCRKLRLKGYSEFRFFLSQSIGSEENPEENDADIILDNMVSALESTHDLLDHRQIHKAAGIILNARRIYAMGSGNSGVAAQELSNKVMRYGVNINRYEDNHFQTIVTSLLDERDVIVLFSVSGGTKDMLDIAKQASQQGVKLIIVTNYLKSPLAKYATALLYVVAKSTPLDSGSLVSKVSQLYVIDVLSKEIFRQMNGRAEVNQRKTAMAVMDKEV